MEEIKELLSSLVKMAVNNSKQEDTEAENSKGDNMERIENEKVDKRKLIDEVAGIMKSAGCDDEVIRTAIGKMEKIGYDKSEADDKADNKAKNADEEEKEEKFEEEKEIAENKKAKNEDEEKEEDKKEDKEAENKCKNSMDDVKKAVFGGKSEKQTQYIPHSKRLELGNNY